MRRPFEYFFWLFPTLVALVCTLVLVVERLGSETLPVLVDWNKWNAIGTWAMTGVVLATAAFAWLQWLTSKNTSQTEILVQTFAALDQERQDRRILFKIDDDERCSCVSEPHDDKSRWTKEELDAANVVAARFNTIGILVLYDKIDSTILLNEWRDKIIRLRRILDQYIARERAKNPADQRLWSCFDRLAELAERHVITDP